MSVPLFELRGLVRSFGRREALVLDELDVREGEILGVAGHNGSGKSTLMMLLAFLDAPTSGTLRYRGRPCSGLDASLRREVTLLTQEPYLLKRSVAANVAYGLRVRGVHDTEAAVGAALEEVGLEPATFLSRSWRELSGGEAQRVALAARLVLRPRVLLLDEPTSNLDPESAKLIHSAALAARDRGTTLVAVSHDGAWLESVCDRIATMRCGRLEELRET